jgi:hypothetical protein
MISFIMMCVMMFVPLRRRLGGSASRRTAGTTSRGDALREVLILHAQSDGVGLRCSDQPDAVTESEHPQDGGVHAESNRRITALDTPERCSVDTGPFGDHFGREPPAPPGTLNVRPELPQRLPNSHRQEWGDSGHP